LKPKVLAYITRLGDSQVLVFAHKHHPEAGLQVPGGSVEEGEELLAALWREIKEESGLSRLDLVGQIAKSPFCNPHTGEWQERNIFHLRASDESTDTWLHIVKGQGEDLGLHFEFTWLAVGEAALVLSASQGEWLHAINSVGKS
jgi:8-oxo-dGTP diphosphatase